MEKESHLRGEDGEKIQTGKNAGVMCMYIFVCGTNVHSNVRVTRSLCKPVLYLYCSAYFLPEVL